MWGLRHPQLRTGPHFSSTHDGTEPQTTTLSRGDSEWNDTQATGDYLIDTYKLYVGTERRHAGTGDATVSLHCLLTALSKPSLSGTCEAVLARASSMVVATVPRRFNWSESHLQRPDRVRHG